MRIRGSFSRSDAESIATESRKHSDVFEVVAEQQSRAFRNPLWSLLIPAGHDLLTDVADWDAPTWAMQPAGLNRLAATLEWLYERLAIDFTFEAMWGTPKGEVAVSRSKLLEIVRAGEIGNNMVYRVEGTPRT